MNTQPEAHALADILNSDGRHISAALLRTQHADIERKDALLRQALDYIAYVLFDDDQDGNAIHDAINKELSK